MSGDDKLGLEWPVEWPKPRRKGARRFNPPAFMPGLYCSDVHLSARDKVYLAMDDVCDLVASARLAIWYGKNRRALVHIARALARLTVAAARLRAHVQGL